VKPFSKALALALFIPLAVSGPSVLAQQGLPAKTSGANIGPEELLAQPIGADWSSYNGDYTGRRYSSLREIDLQTVAKLRGRGYFVPAIPKGSK
jgi:glucose dehydrogenase